VVKKLFLVVKSAHVDACRSVLGTCSIGTGRMRRCVPNTRKHRIRAGGSAYPRLNSADREALLARLEAALRPGPRHRSYSPERSALTAHPHGVALRLGAAALRPRRCAVAGHSASGLLQRGGAGAGRTSVSQRFSTPLLRSILLVGTHSRITTAEDPTRKGGSDPSPSFCW
jgi:hypothetical protein